MYKVVLSPAAQTIPIRAKRITKTKGSLNTIIELNLKRCRVEEEGAGANRGDRATTALLLLRLFGRHQDRWIMHPKEFSPSSNFIVLVAPGHDDCIKDVEEARSQKTSFMPIRMSSRMAASPALLLLAHCCSILPCQVDPFVSLRLCLLTSWGNSHPEVPIFKIAPSFLANYHTNNLLLACPLFSSRTLSNVTTAIPKFRPSSDGQESKRALLVTVSQKEIFVARLIPRV
ncbi:hypothetical protein VTL71DRAFT_9452 [Oculimacula yallundae]|uniref:Uncharacterized protein n=1 Tax=Oculimacula yallundae TaxID=86028 RepID=A0ABR4BSS8_9HELO